MAYIKNIKRTVKRRCYLVWTLLVAHLHVFLVVIISIQFGLFGDLALRSLHLLLAFRGRDGVRVGLPLVVLLSFFAVITLLLLIVVPSHLCHI